MAKPHYNGPWPKIRRLVLERDHHLCQIRGKNCTGTATTVDHIVPIKHGGDHRLSNLQAACPNCNYSKGAGHYPQPRTW